MISLRGTSEQQPANLRCAQPHRLHGTNAHTNALVILNPKDHLHETHLPSAPGPSGPRGLRLRRNGARVHRLRPVAAVASRREIPAAHGQGRHRRNLARRADAHTGSRLRRDRIRARSRPSALALRTPERRHPGRRIERPTQGRGQWRHPRLLHEARHGQGRCGRAQRQPHHPAARRRWERHRRSENGVHDRPHVALRHDIAG